MALARALAAEPELLLLDEPLAAADVRTAGELRQVLRAHLRDEQRATVIVTHEVLDAAVLADRVLVLQDGTIVDGVRPQLLLTRPGTEFGAALAGLNLVVGTAVAADALQIGSIHVSGIADEPLRPGTPPALVFPPAAVAIFPGDPEGSPRNHWFAEVLSIEPGPAAARVRLQLADGVALAADVTPAAVAALPIVPGMSLWIQVKAAQVQLFPH